jgi:predicted nicotinamide N-methyase
MLVKKVKVHDESLSDELFQKSLYKNAHLLRIVLNKPIEQHIQIDKWYRMDLKLVTEMGLLVDQHQHNIQLNGLVIIDNILKPAFPIEIRPISEDAWNPEVAKSMGFLASKAIGGLEYRITGTVVVSDPVYISLQVADRQSNSPTILPLTVGPIWLQTPLSTSQNWSNKEFEDLEQQQFRALRTCQNKCFLLKEQWHIGTPGKIWDSAIVMTDILKSIFNAKPCHFSGKRILDLSAGTGYIGLSFAQLYQQHTVESPPHITLTDLPEALQLIRENQSLNNIQSTPYLNIEPLSWGNKKDVEAILARGKLDIVIASDVLYNTAHFAKLVSTLRDLCDKHTRIYLCYKQRGLTIEEERSFFILCKTQFQVSLLKQFKHEMGVKIYQLRKKHRSIKYYLNTANRNLLEISKIK